MADTDTTPTTEELQASIDKLKAALEKERTEHKAARLQLTTLGDVEQTITERTAAITAERDAAKAEADKIKAQWSDEKITSALDAAFAASGAKPEFKADFMLLAKPLFGLKDGRVVTSAEGEVPGMDPAQWCIARYRSLRPGHFPLSTGGNARGPASTPPSGPDLGCFRAGATNLTEQFRLVGHHGSAAVRDALKRAGLDVPRWLNA